MAILYDKWRQVAREHSGVLALTDLASGRDWTFAQLAAEVEAMPAVEPVVFPDTADYRFVLLLLAAWRDNAVVCPLEPGQGRPFQGRIREENRGARNLVHLKQTSATTGQARCVAFTAEQLMADCRNILRTMGLRQEWPNLGVISLAHSYGFSNLVLPLLLEGIPLILVGSALPEALRQAAQSRAGFTLAGVPALWRVWHEARAIPGAVRLALSAGAPLPLALEEAVHTAWGLKIHNFYGATETGGIAYDASLVPRTDPACVGTPLQGAAVGIGPEGAVEVRGDAVGSTYWPEAQDSLQGGVFRTGDLGELIEGRLYLRGRFSDLINVAGRKVSPEQIEQVLRQHPRVAECVVFGVPCPGEQRGEVIVACVAARSRLSPDDLREYAGGHLPVWQVPREWVFEEQLVVNLRGKLSRAECRRNYLAKRNR